MNVDVPITDARDVYAHGLQIRFLVSTALLLFFIAVCALGILEGSVGCRALISVLVLLIVVNAPLWVIGKARAFPRSDFYWHWLIDFGGVSAAVYWLGLLDVPLAAVAYMIMIVSSATFATMRTSFALAALASTCYVSLIVAEGQGIIPHYHVASTNHLARDAQLFFASGTVLLFFIFAYLSGSLATQLRNNAAEIERQRVFERLARENMVLLSSIVQHDVYSPLGIVSGACSEALSSCTEGDLQSVAHYINMVRRRLNSIESAVASLGLFGAVAESDNEEVEDLEQVARQVSEDLVEECSERHVTLIITGEWPLIKTARAPIYHVLRNLVSNAVRCVPEDGTGRVTLKGGHSPTTEEWCVTVDDNGPGLPEDVAAGLSVSVAPPLRKRPLGGGFGAGLLLSRNLALSWNGNLTYRPSAVGGAEFTISLPRRVLA